MAMILGDRDTIQAIEPVKLVDMLLHGVCDVDANGQFPLQVKQLSPHLLDQDGEEIVTAIAVTKPACMTPTNAVTMPTGMSSTNADAVQDSTDAVKEHPVQDTPVQDNALDVAANPNPQAAPFTPVQEHAQPVQPTIGTPEQFLFAYRQRFIPRKHAIEIVPPHRRIAFKDLPHGTTISDVLCLVHGGAVDRAWKVTDNEIIVQFCDDAACNRYHQAYSNGIRVNDNHVITIEKPLGTEPIKPALQEKINMGVTRVVRVSGISKDKTLEALLQTVGKYDLDHIVWRGNGDKDTEAWFLFANLTHAWEFKDQLQVDPAFEYTETEYMADPCKEASEFHSNDPVTGWDLSKPVAA